MIGNKNILATGEAGYTCSAPIMKLLNEVHGVFRLRAHYERDPTTVAKALFGKILMGKVNSKVFSGKIAESKAYYGEGRLLFL